MAEPVHQLHLAQHVPSVAGQLVHLQHQDLSRLTVPHLQGQLSVTPGHPGPVVGAKGKL